MPIDFWSDAFASIFPGYRSTTNSHRDDRYIYRNKSRLIRGYDKTQEAGIGNSDEITFTLEYSFAA
jgi:hypothetical protein